MNNKKKTVNEVVKRIIDSIDSESEIERKDPSNNYISTGRNEDQIEIKGIKKPVSSFKPHPDESNEKDDIEESNSFKPSTKEDPKLAKGKNKVAPEKEKNENKNKLTK